MKAPKGARRAKTIPEPSSPEEMALSLPDRILSAMIALGPGARIQANAHHARIFSVTIPALSVALCRLATRGSLVRVGTLCKPYLYGLEFRTTSFLPSA